MTWSGKGLRRSGGKRLVPHLKTRIKKITPGVCQGFSLSKKCRTRERLHKEVASPLGFVAGQIDRIVGKINHTGGLQNETALHR